MEKELYIKSCCIDKKLPKMLRENEGRLITFYSQGEWHVEKLWDAVSHMVSNVIQSTDPEVPVAHTGGRIHMLLVLPTLDAHILETILRYRKRGWFSHLTVICHNTSLSFKQISSYQEALSDASSEATVNIVLGKRAAAQQNLWLRWDDKTLQTLFVSGPMFTTKYGNPPFATYTATFLDSVSSNETDSSLLTPHSSLLTQVTDIWRDMIGQEPL